MACDTHTQSHREDTRLIMTVDDYECAVGNKNKRDVKVEEYFRSCHSQFFLSHTLLQVCVRSSRFACASGNYWLATFNLISDHYEHAGDMKGMAAQSSSWARPTHSPAHLLSFQKVREEAASSSPAIDSDTMFLLVCLWDDSTSVPLSCMMQVIRSRLPTSVMPPSLECTPSPPIRQLLTGWACSYPQHDPDFPRNNQSILRHSKRMKVMPVMTTSRCSHNLVSRHRPRRPCDAWSVAACHASPFSFH